MNDIAIVWDAERSQGDWQLAGNGALLTAQALETAVLVSLFTDARAEPDDRLPPGDADRRGWWGNALGEEPIGSRLWLLRRAKRLPETLALARDYIREALAWLVGEGIAARVEVTTSWQDRGRINALIVISQADGSRAALRAEWAWEGL